MNYDISECLFSKNNLLENFLTELSQGDINKLNGHISTISIKKGYPIFQEGDMPKGLMYIKKGSAKVFKNKSGKREQIVRLAGSSSFMGYKALFAEKPHTTNATAIDNTDVIIIDKKKLFELMDQNPGMSRIIIRALASELSFNFERLINLTQKHVRGRLAETLILLTKIYGFESDGQTLNISITRENIGLFSNMSTANAIRTIKAFEREGLIEASNHKLQLLNLTKLEEIGVRG